jgi:hypothetical protein
MMSKEQFDARLDAIEKATKAKEERAKGYRDQALAKLFVKSGWSQRELAEHLGRRWGKEVSREWVTKRLLFGRFLTFFGTSCTEESSPGAHFKLSQDLTEGKFRGFWEDGGWRVGSGSK